MNYLVQVWDPYIRGAWDSTSSHDVEADARRSAMAISPDQHQRVRIIAIPSIMDVLDMLHELEHAGLVEVRLVDTEWRWTVREGVE